MAQKALTDAQLFEICLFLCRRTDHLKAMRRLIKPLIKELRDNVRLAQFGVLFA